MLFFLLNCIFYRLQRGRLLRVFADASRSCSSSAATTKLFIDGRVVESQTSRWIDLHNPATNEVVTRVPITTQDEMEQAVVAAKKAYSSWKNTSVLTRQQLMLKLQALIRRDMKKIATNITEEQGKTLADAEGDVLRGLQVVEHACAAGTLLQGETMANVAKDMDTVSHRVPLGVTAGICPFNFPAMIPLWMFPMALIAGNTSIIKPSERDPGNLFNLPQNNFQKLFKTSLQLSSETFLMWPPQN